MELVGLAEPAEPTREGAASPLQAEAAEASADAAAAKKAAQADEARQAAADQKAAAAKAAAKEAADRKAAEKRAATEAAKQRAAQEAAQAKAAKEKAAAQAARNNPAGAKAYAEGALASFGWGAGELGCLETLWHKESEWDLNATNPSSGAYGIPQALPGNKMAAAGADWQTNVQTQVDWGLGYIESRYGSPCSALNFHLANNWY